MILFRSHVRDCPFCQCKVSKYTHLAADKLMCVFAVCSADLLSCGCCLMKKQMNRLEMYFNITAEEMNKQLTMTKLALNNMRGE